MSKKTNLALVFLLVNLLTILYFTQLTVTISQSFTPQFDNLDNSVTINNFENETLLAHNMNVRIQTDNSIKITSTFVLANNDSVELANFLLIINRTINSIICFDPIGSLEFNWQVDPTIGNIVNITLRNPLSPSDVYVFSVSYYINEALYLVEGAVEYYGLDFEAIHPRKTELFNLEIYLPNNARLLTDSPPDPVFPQADKIYLDNEIYVISWQLANRNMNESDIFLLRYEFIPDDSIASSNLAPLFYFLAVVSGIGVGIGSTYLFYRRQKEPKENELMTSLLSKSEQEIIASINVDGGVSTQRRICDKTGFSKSKVSQILAKLEKKKVLKRERWGRTNKVTIINDSFKKIDGELEEKPMDE